MVSGLFHRARAITQGENREREEEHLLQVLQENGYPYEVDRAASQPRLQRTREEQPRHTLYIPYVAELGEDLRRICRKYSIRTVLSWTPSTFRQELSRIKDRDPALKTFGVVYEIPCSCEKKYIGETKRVLETHLKEHQAATRRGETEKSAIAEHAWSRQHQALWGETRILDHASHHTALLIKEAKHISLRDPVELFNWDQGLDIDYCWKHLVKGTRRQQQSTVELDLGDVICFMTSPDTSLTNQCSFDTLVRSPVVLLSVYSDEGHSIVAKMSVKFYCESVGWNRRNNRYNNN